MAQANLSEYMKLAIEQAKLSTAEDNRFHPKVGAVLVKDNKLVDYAYRGEANDGAHAEYSLLAKKLRNIDLKGTTLFTTLEPCVNRNKHKPCAEWIIEREISEVYIGILDPNPKIYAQGYKKLKEAGIRIGFFPQILRDEIQEDNLRFIEQFRASPKLFGTVSFDYTNNNGVFTIGHGECIFETRWSGGSSTSIHVYNDATNIKSVALADGARELDDIIDAGIYDSSSRVRTVNEDGFLVLQNTNGYFAAIHVIDVEAKIAWESTQRISFQILDT